MEEFLLQFNVILADFSHVILLKSDEENQSSGFLVCYFSWCKMYTHMFDRVSEGLGKTLECIKCGRTSSVIDKEYVKHYWVWMECSLWRGECYLNSWYRLSSFRTMIDFHTNVGVGYIPHFSDEVIIDWKFCEKLFSSLFICSFWFLWKSWRKIIKIWCEVVL